jgi:hypothetical protein
MKIMGILSAFTIAAMSFVLNKVLSDESGKSAAPQSIWACGSPFIIAASAFMLISALFFYRQRSLLAYYYGQICLCLNHKPSKVRALIVEADSWATWIHYRWAFGFLFLGFSEYFITLAASTSCSNSCWPGKHWPICILGPFLLVLSILVGLTHILTKYKSKVRPICAFWRKLTRKK